MQRLGRKSRSGFTLLETALVLGIAMVVISAIWWAASNAREATHSDAAYDEMSMIVQNVNQVMMGQSFQNITVQTNLMTAAGAIGPQVVPTSYIDASTPTTIDSPWSAKNFYLWALKDATPNSKKFRVSFYNVTMQGCLSLLQKATACQPGQVGCPIQVGTGGKSSPVAPSTANSCKPNFTCPGEATAVANVGWGLLNVAAEQALCASTVNNYTGAAGTANSVEFDYQL